MRIKICGITKPEQGNAIAKLGATALGFICVASSPRYVTPQQIRAIVEELEVSVDRIGVFVNSQIEEICQIVIETGLTGVQLHGNESLEFCTKLRQLLPQREIIKALRIKTRASLQKADNYANHVDTLLLDAYHPQQLGGTGITLDWETLAEFTPKYPWFLAGGLTPNNILDALKLLKPTGIDLSSGVEVSPGDKDLAKVALLLEAIYS